MNAQGPCKRMAQSGTLHYAANLSPSRLLFLHLHQLYLTFGCQGLQVHTSMLGGSHAYNFHCWIRTVVGNETSAHVRSASCAASCRSTRRTVQAGNQVQESAAISKTRDALGIWATRQGPGIVHQGSQLRVELGRQAFQSCQLRLPSPSSSAFQLCLHTLGKQLAAHQPHRHALTLTGSTFAV